MEWIECPHCHRRVMVSSTHICPACQGDTSFPPQGSADEARITLDATTRLPWICCMCGTETENWVTVRENLEKGGGDGAARVLLSLLALVFGFLLLLGKARGGRSVRMRLRIPHCKPCKKKGPLTSTYIDFDRETMEFVVHRQFAVEVEKLN